MTSLNNPEPSPLLLGFTLTKPLPLGKLFVGDLTFPLAPLALFDLVRSFSRAIAFWTGVHPKRLAQPQP